MTTINTTFLSTHVHFTYYMWGLIPIIVALIIIKLPQIIAYYKKLLNDLRITLSFAGYYRKKNAPKRSNKK